MSCTLSLCVCYVIQCELLYVTVRRAPVPAPREIRDCDKWACTQCTYLNHPLMRSCEMCDTQRLSSPGNNNHTALSMTTSPSSQRQTLVRTSSCQHNSGCFCHAHLGWLTDSRSLRFLFCVSEISETVSRFAPKDKSCYNAAHWSSNKYCDVCWI